MSGIEIIGLISAAVEGIKLCKTIYEAIKDTKDLPEAFHEVSKQLPLTQSTLEAAERAARDAAPEGNDGPNNLGNEWRSMLTTIKSCNKKVEDLKKIFREARALHEDGHPVKKGYQAVVNKLGGTNHRVEALMRGILDNVLSLSANHVFRLATQDQVDKIKQAVEALNALEPSVEDGSQMAGNRFEFSGTGNQYNQTGTGDMWNVADGGNVNRGDYMNVGYPPRPHPPPSK